MKAIFYTLFLLTLVQTDFNAQTSFTVYKNAVLEGNNPGAVTQVNNFADSPLYMENGQVKSPHFVSSTTVDYGSSSTIDITALSNPRELMTLYHLTEVSAFSKSLFGNAHPFYEGNNHVLVNVKTELNKDFPTIESEPNGDVMLEFSLPSNPNAAYYPLAEDAYAIARGYFTLVYKGMANNNVITGEGTDMGLGTYFAHQYMLSKGFNTSSNLKMVHTHGGHADPVAPFVNAKAWQTLSSDLYSFITPDYYKNVQGLGTNHKRSEIFFAALWKLREILTVDENDTRWDDLIIETMPTIQDNPSEPKNQVYVASKIYRNAWLNSQLPMGAQFDATDLCIILDVFTDAYDNAFFELVNTNEIPVSSTGDTYIKDNATHAGQEVTSGDITNSPSIWNRYTQDYAPAHQSPYGTGAPTTQYVHVTLDGNFCDLQAMQQTLGDINIKVYRSLTNVSNQWETDWNNPSEVNDPLGDLIGTLVINGSQFIFTDDSGNVNTNWDWMNNGNRIVFSFPWQVPDYFSVFIPPIGAPDWKDGGPGTEITPGNFGFTDAFLARVESTNYDPMNAESTPGDVFENVRNNNNIAMKTSNIVLQSVWQGSNEIPFTPGMLLPPGNDDPDDIVLTVGPSTYEPVRPANPNSGDGDGPFIPMVPETNNFMDYGDVAFVLDEHTFDDWVANGSQGNGFTINADNEIVVTASDFSIRGIPRSISGTRNRVIGVRFYSDQSFTTRTGFDVVVHDANHKFLGSTHFEVRESFGNSAPRNESKAEVAERINIYPNPVNGDQLHIRHITNSGVYTIVGIDGKTHAHGQYSKDQSTLDISVLRGGVYFIRFTKADGSVETKKLFRL